MFKWLSNAGKRWNKANKDFERRATKWRCNDGFHSCWGRCIPKDQKCGSKQAAGMAARTVGTSMLMSAATKPLGHAGAVIGPEAARMMEQRKTRIRHDKKRRKSKKTRKAYKQYD